VDLKPVVAGMFAAVLAACSPQPAGAPAADAPPASPLPAAQAGNTPPEHLDPFVVMIGAERWTVLLDRALEGAREAPEPISAAEEGELYRADAALKNGAAMLIELRNRVCRKGLLEADACTLPDFPAWTREPPTGATPIEEIDRRSGWLDTVMGPYVGAGCDAGRKALQDDMFCSVE
jgi:hypothetical protein